MYNCKSRYVKAIYNWLLEIGLLKTKRKKKNKTKQKQTKTKKEKKSIKQFCYTCYTRKQPRFLTASLK